MKNKIIISIFALFSIASFSQENSKTKTEKLVENLNTYKRQEHLVENSKKVEINNKFSNVIPIPTAKPTENGLYSILKAPINKNFEYKILNWSGERSKQKIPFLFKK